MTTRITTQNITDATITATDIATSVPLGTDWQTVVTSDTTMVSGRGYIVDSSGGTKTMTLPSSPSAGDFVEVFQSGANEVTIARGGSNIKGAAENQTLSNGSSMKLIYSSSATIGWITGNDDTPPSTFISATGGTISTSGNYKIHSFTSSGNFVVTDAGNQSGVDEVSYIVVGGGGAAGDGDGTHGGGGGGAGGYREGRAGNDTYTVSPLNAPAGITVTTQTYPITVGAGGARADSGGASGANSVFSTITSAGGGFGQASYSHSQPDAGDGGSGGGAAVDGNPGDQGSGNVPPVSPPQGNNGGNTGSQSYAGGSGGGGAGQVGQNGTAGNGTNTAGPGGNGVTSSITGSPVARAGGGAGASRADTNNHGTGGSGGGGPSGAGNGTAGTANTGGGGGSGHSGSSSGGAGVVIIRYKYQ